MSLDLNDFEMEKVINEDAGSKHLALHLKKTKTNNKNESSNVNAILLLKKLPFNSIKPLSYQISNLKSLDSNDIYHRFIDHDRGIEAKLIYPASEAHLKKYTEQHRTIIVETPEMHAEITRPHFEFLRSANQTNWIDNILANTSETKRRLYDNQCSNSGFVILPDYKWTDESNLNGFYLLVIPRRKDLWSVRDLTGEHLDLLENIRNELVKMFNGPHSKKRFTFSDNSPITYNHLRIFFHYPPTYPHLHIHVTLAAASSYAACAAGQAILLDEVIDNLKMVSSNYYCKLRTLPMEFGAEHELYLKLKEFQLKKQQQ